MKKRSSYLSTQDYFLTQESFEIVNTDVSGLLATHPVPADLARYYDTQEYLSHNDSGTGLFARLYRTVRQFNLRFKTKLINDYLKGGKLLDVGAGNGVFVKHLQDQKISAAGYEPNTLARKKALQNGIQLLSKLPQAKGAQFDVITMFHVLEHVEDPKAYIGCIAEMLTENGILILALPNYESFDAKFFDKYWAGWDVPRHLFHFNEDAVKEVCDVEFKFIKSLPMWWDAFYVSILSSRYQETIIALLKGVCIGAYSNFVALFTKKTSSRIYVLQKAN
jgi:SAM-dependent methyltransferase